MLTACWAGSSRTATGFLLVNGADIRLSNCSAINNAQWGALIQGAAEVQIEGGLFAGNSKGTNNTYDGVAVAAGVGDFTITGIRTGGSLYAGGQCGAAPCEVWACRQRYGINVEPGTSARYVITNNRLYHNNTAALRDGGTGGNKIVTNNVSTPLACPPLP